MTAQEGYQVKKKIIPGLLDVHPTDLALIVFYSVQATILTEDGIQVVEDKKDMQKVQV